MAMNEYQTPRTYHWAVVDQRDGKVIADESGRLLIFDSRAKARAEAAKGRRRGWAYEIVREVEVWT